MELLKCLSLLLLMAKVKIPEDNDILCPIWKKWCQNTCLLISRAVASLVSGHVCKTKPAPAYTAWSPPRTLTTCGNHRAKSSFKSQHLSCDSLMGTVTLQNAYFLLFNLPLDSTEHSHLPETVISMWSSMEFYD